MRGPPGGETMATVVFAPLDEASSSTSATEDEIGAKPIVGRSRAAALAATATASHDCERRLRISKRTGTRNRERRAARRSR